MLILSVDTSSKSGSVALLRESALLGCLSDTSNEPYSSRLFRYLEAILGEQGVSLPQIDLYAVSSGPGTFTGLRVGLTAVKGWAEVFGKPIAPVSSLEAVAAQAASQDALLAAVLDAHRGQIFGGLYARSGDCLRRVTDDVVMSAIEYLEMIRDEAAGAPLVFLTPHPWVLQSALEASPLHSSPVQEVSPVLAPVIGRLGLELAKRGKAVDSLSLDAHYIRRSDAELLWKEPA